MHVFLLLIFVIFVSSESAAGEKRVRHAHAINNPDSSNGRKLRPMNRKEREEITTKSPSEENKETTYVPPGTYEDVANYHTTFIPPADYETAKGVADSDKDSSGGSYFKHDEKGKLGITESPEELQGSGSGSGDGDDEDGNSEWGGKETDEEGSETYNNAKEKEGLYYGSGSGSGDGDDEDGNREWGRKETDGEGSETHNNGKEKEGLYYGSGSGSGSGDGDDEDGDREWGRKETDEEESETYNNAKEKEGLYYGKEWKEYDMHFI